MRAGLALAGITSAASCTGRPSARRPARHAQAGRGVETAHGVAGRSAVGRADARVLVRVGGDVGDELLRGQREEPRQVRRRLVGAVAWRWEAGERQVVRCYGVGDLFVG